MFCTNCGRKLKDTAKFCGACGTRVEPPPDPVPPPVSARLELSPLAAGLPLCAVEIVGVEVEGPDDDDDVRVTVRYTLANDTYEDWEYIDARTQLLSAAGVLIDETRDTHEQTVSAGETAELEATFWQIKALQLGANPHGLQVVVSLLACGFAQQSLGEVAIPSTAFEAVALAPVDVGALLKVVSGGVWRTEPDDEKECRVEVKVLVQNLTEHQIPELRLVAEVTDKQGREVADAGTRDEVRPGAIVVVAGSGYGKERKLEGARALLAVRVYPPLAQGIAQHQGQTGSAPVSRPPYPKQTADDESSAPTEELNDIFADMEDSLLSKSLLVGLAPDTMLSVRLEPEFYDDDGRRRIKCKVCIECSDEPDLDDDTLETISDAVSDFCRERDLEQRLEDIGLDGDAADWWPVEFVRV